MDHDHYTGDYLSDILLTAKTVAVLGASPRDSRPSHWVVGFLLGKGYRVYPVNPAHAGETILGQPVYADLRDIPEPVDIVDVFRSSSHLEEVVDAVLALPKRPAAIWGQLGVRDDHAAERAEAAGIRVVMDRALVTEYPLVYQRLHASGQALTA